MRLPSFLPLPGTLSPPEPRGARQIQVNLGRQEQRRRIVRDAAEIEEAVGNKLGSCACLEPDPRLPVGRLLVGFTAQALFAQ